MLDILIRGGTIVDGTGAPARPGDVGIADGRIVEIGGQITTPARETIDATGKIVTPGFVDIHTHYDGQVMWDDALDSSFSNGVTTIVAGNCGVGFAPARPEFRKELIEMMEGVEDIPGIVLDEGLDWSWRSFPDYLAKVAARRYTMDVAFQIAHAPLRVFVMGERALAHEAATPAEIAEMAQLVREAVEQGAVGFSAARIVEHKTSTGAFVPGTFAGVDELGAIARAMGETGKGVFQIVPLGAAGNIAGSGSSRDERLAEHRRLVEIAAMAKRPLTYLLMLPEDDTEDWQVMLKATEDAVRDDGVDMYAQVHGRGVGLLATLDGYHPFQLRPSYIAIASLPLAERVVALRDPARRAAILGEADVAKEAAPSARVHMLVNRFFTDSLRFHYLMRLPLDYEPRAATRLDALSAETGRPVQELVYDHLAEADGHQFTAYFVQNYVTDGLSEIGDLLGRPLTRIGLADGGAHLQLSCDAALPTFLLTHWARDRSRGRTLPLEQIVRTLTLDNASLYDMDDRGSIEVGKRADVNVIDFAHLELELPQMVFDLPEGGKRLLQSASGYAATIVNGVVTRRDDRDTGARPGRLYRSRVRTPAPVLVPA